MEKLLPPQTLPAVSHIDFSIFNLDIPGIVMWVAAIIIFFIAAWARMPKTLERKP